MISGVAMNVGEDGKIAWLSGGIVFTFALFIWSLVAAIMEVASQSSLGGRRTAYLAIANFVFLLVVLGIVLFSSHGQTPKPVAKSRFEKGSDPLVVAGEGQTPFRTVSEITAEVSV